MRLIDYGKYGYECLNESGSVLLSEDDSHYSLFEYITKDLSAASNVFEAYIRCRLDLKTLKVHKDSSGDEYFKQIEKILIPMHPYYQHAFSEACKNIIGEFFNRLLLYCCYQHENTFNAEIAKSKEWYLDTLNYLMEPFLQYFDRDSARFYNKYLEIINEDFYTGDSPKEEFSFLINGVPSTMPHIFDDAIIAQRTLRNMLYYVLDITAQDFSYLKTSQRLWIFVNIFYNQFKKLNTSAERRFFFNQYLPLEYINGNYNNIFSKLASLDGMDIENGEVSQEEKEALYKAIDLANKKEDIRMFEEYEVISLEQLLYIEIMSMIRDEIMIRKCRNCGKYFVVTNRNTAYCDRRNESGKGCSAIGSSGNFGRKMEEDEALKIYTRAYKTHFARVKKGTMEKAAFTEWCKEAKGKLEHVRSGLLDMAAFQEWLKR